MTTLTKQESSGLSAKIKAREVVQESGDLYEQKYTFSIDVTIIDKIQVPKTQVTIPNDMKISQASKIALQKFKLQLQKQGIYVDQNIQNYKPRLAKKNGKAKTDMPCLDYTQILADVKVKSICLDPKDQSIVSQISNSNQQKELPIPKSPPQTIQKQIQIEPVKKQSSGVVENKELNSLKPESNCICLIF